MKKVSLHPTHWQGNSRNLSVDVLLTAAVAALVWAAVEGIEIAVVWVGAACSMSTTEAEVIEVCRVVLEKLILISVMVPNRAMLTEGLSTSSGEQKLWDETSQPLTE